MRFVAAFAAFESHGRMFEGERAAFISVALEAAGVITRESLGQGGAAAAMGIVAINAAHRSFGQLVMIGFLKLRPDVHVTAGAEFVDRPGIFYHQTHWPVGVDFVAGNAGDLVFYVAALNSSGVLGAARVAGEASLVRQSCRHFRRIPDIGGRRGTRVRAAGTVARFAGATLPSRTGTLLHRAVRALHERTQEVFMTGLASLGTDVFGRLGLRGRRNTGR